MVLTTTSAYTQAELDADITAITDDLESAVLHAGRIKANWVRVQSLHPGVTAVEYIHNHVPYLNRNMAVAVALVKAGVTTTADAGRLIGRSKQAVSKAASSTQVDVSKAKPTTLATGATAPGPAIGTPKKASKPIATVTATRPVPPMLFPEQWGKVRQAIAVILAADDDQVIAVINGYPDADKRRACALLMRSTAIRMNRLRKEVNP